MLCIGSTSSFGKTIGTEAEKEKLRPVPRAFVINENWSEDLKSFFMHLRELGLIFIRKRKDGFEFYMAFYKNYQYVFVFFFMRFKNTWKLIASVITGTFL